MENMFPLRIFIVYFLTIHTGLQARNCNDVKYITINDARRSTAHKSANTTSKYLCDRSIIKNNAWYRFSNETGGEMPTTQPKHERCGTYAPIWMNGSHPTVMEGTVKRKACVVVPHVPPLGCSRSYNISVRNCSGYYIYQLKKPQYCHVAYCAGSILPNCSNADPKDYCLGNRPPYISMPDKLYTFSNSEFQLVFNATDREGHPMYYNYLPNAISRISIDHKQKLITMSVTKSGRITFTVDDDGSVQANHTIEFVVVSCRCKNRGKCYTNDKTNVSTKSRDLNIFASCDCVKPYAGRFCDVSPCDKQPCFPGLNCSVEVGSYTCKKCPTQFQGDGKDCKLIPTNDTVVVEVELTIVSGLKWNDDLLDNTSLFYKKRTAEIVTEIIQAYTGAKYFLFVVVIGYRKGSVLVDFQIVLNKNRDDPLEPLRERVQKNENLGKFKVDLPRRRESKKEKTPRVSSKDRLYFGLDKVVFIVVVCLVSILALVAIVVCGVCIKRKPISIIMLTRNDDHREICPNNSNNDSCFEMKKRPSHNQVVNLETLDSEGKNAWR